MKYYKLIVGGHAPIVVGKIYKEDYIFISNWTVSKSALHWPKDYIEVQEWEYYQQEGLPDKWWIKSTPKTYKEIYGWLNKFGSRQYHVETLSNSDQCSNICFPALNNSDQCMSSFHQSKGDKTYTEINFETFKKLVLKEEQQNKTVNMEKKLVKVVNSGKIFTNHPKAEEYGLTNYHFWKGLPECKNGDILEIVKEVMVNDSKPSYILRDKEGVEYLIRKEGVEDYKEKTQERVIIGYKLKEDCKQYEEAAQKIAEYRYNESDPFERYLQKNYWGSMKDRLTKAGVLDLWFEPVYEEEEEFKVGDWVINKQYPQYIGRVRRVERDKVYYGPEKEGNDFKTSVRKATTKEIESHLIEQAKKLGYKEGVEFNYKEQGYGESILQGNIKGDLKVEYYDKLDIGWRILSKNGCGVIYSDKIGWAEILPSHPTIEVNSYKGEFFDTYVKFGYAEIDVDWFITLNSLRIKKQRTNRDLESVTIGKGTFTSKQIREIAEYYTNKKNQ